MGNQPNNFIQCGTDQKDTKQQSFSTRQQAIRQNKGKSIFNSQIVQSKVGSVKIINQNTNPQTPQYTNKLKENKNYIPQHENILRLSKTPKNMYVIVGGGQYFEEERGKCLDQIIESRYNTTMHFPEYQIRSLLECLVYSLAYMSKKSINYHDFYPTNIFYNNGSFKILNPLTAKKSGYSLTQERKRFSFLSPELILEVLNDTPEENIPQNVMDKSDVFAIGMILLEFCTLTPSSQCYDPQTYSIVDSTINERVQTTRELYNPRIADCIDLMLQYEVDKRIPPQELAYAVHSNIQQIRDAEANQMSRVQQMSRMTFSQTPSQPPPQLQNQPRIIMPPPGYVADPKIQGGRIVSHGPIPPFVLQEGVQGGTPLNTTSGPYKVSSNPPTNLGQYPPNLPLQPYGSNYVSSNVSSLPTMPQNFNFQTIKVPPMSSQIYNQKVQKFNSEPQPAFGGYKKASQLVPNYSSNYIPNQKVPQILTQTSSKSTFLASQLTSSSKSPQPSSSVLSTKQKLNPFQQIQQDVKEDEDESPNKNVPTFGIGNSSNPGNSSTGNSNSGYQNYFHSYSSPTNNFTTTTTTGSSAYRSNLSSQIGSKYESNKTQGSYTFKTTPYTSSYSNTFVNSSFGEPSKSKQESLDERVRKILEASKNIK